MPKKNPKEMYPGAIKKIEGEKESGKQSNRKRELVTVKPNPNSCTLGVCVRVRRDGQEGTAKKKSLRSWDQAGTQQELNFFCLFFWQKQTKKKP